MRKTRRKSSPVPRLSGGIDSRRDSEKSRRLREEAGRVEVSREAVSSRQSCSPAWQAHGVLAKKLTGSLLCNTCLPRVAARCRGLRRVKVCDNNSLRHAADMCNTTAKPRRRRALHKAVRKNAGAGGLGRHAAVPLLKRPRHRRQVAGQYRRLAAAGLPSVQRFDAELSRGRVVPQAEIVVAALTNFGSATSEPWSWPRRACH